MVDLVKTGRNVEDQDPTIDSLLSKIRGLEQELETFRARELEEITTSRQNELLTILLKNLRQGVFMVEAPTGKPLLANDAALKLLGRGILPDANMHNLSEVYRACRVGTNEPYPPQEMPIVLGMYGKSAYIDDMVVVRPDGSMTYLEIFGSPVVDSQGKIWASLVSFSDISERKRIELEVLKAKEQAEESERRLQNKNEEYEAINEELRQTNEELQYAKDRIGESESRFKDIALSMADFIWETDEKDVYTYCSHQGARYMGLPVSEIIGKTPYDFMPEEEVPRIKMLFDAVKEKRQAVKDIENWVESRDGKRYCMLTSGLPMFDKHGKFTGYRGVDKDITEQKIIASALLSAKEKAEEGERLKTAFLQNMSHEIRTPMNAIVGFSNLLDKPNVSEEKRKNYTSIIINSSTQLLAIVSDILTISSIDTRQEKVNLVPVCINSVIMELLTIFKSQASNQNVSLYAKQQLSDSLSEIISDRTKLTQILTNLISNALKFTHEGYIEFGYSLKDGMMEFYVRDSGIGIALEMQGKIFERFRQANEEVNKKYGGTGLGLAISRGFAEMLGGRIWVESEPEKGSTFFFTIPYQPANQEHESGVCIGPSCMATTIVVAEDEEFNFMLVEEMLSDMQLTIIHAKNGKEAVLACQDNLSVSLVLMDIKMPVLDGHTAAIQIKKTRPGLPIIAQSAYAMEHERERYGGHAFDEYVTKPINEKELREKIQKFVVLKPLREQSV